MGATDARVLTADTAIHDAATLVIVRDPGGAPSVLMGQRGRHAAFMPNKVVFPGGRVDPDDITIDVMGALHQTCRDRLSGPHMPRPDALVAAAIRELWEETGQVLGKPAPWNDPPADWSAFAATGHRPAATGLGFVFRAITPPGRPRRFDARFFVVNAAHLRSDPDDFSDACDELSHLQWVPVADARSFDLPFITQVALAEIAARLPDLSPPERVPFFRNDDEDIAIADAARIS